MTDRENKFILEMEHVSKLYEPNCSEAARMMAGGSNKAEVYRKTGSTVALWDVNLQVPRGGIFVIIGLSGSGKSTAVRCFNGLTVPTGGKVLLEGQDILTMSRKELQNVRRNKISMVFQSFALMSHRDVLGNVVYGLEVKGVEREVRERRAREIISMVGLDGWEHHSCDDLSGGMRQRVGIARALANDPEVLLMDEPFSALDPLVRRDMQFELLKIHRKLKKTIVFITHDMDEAFKMGDVVCIMKDGKVVQTGTPEHLTTHPANDYVRNFIDSANKTKVVSVRNIMITPASLVRIDNSVDYAIQQMRRNELSSVFVIDHDLRLLGILLIGAAIEARRQGRSIAQSLRRDVQTVAPDTLIADIISLAAEAPFPLAVVDEEGSLAGIVTKAGILSSLM
ncbi:MAG: quaternary amine ABC transporter ATP-binding protein [Pyramidobacter sp.]